MAIYNGPMASSMRGKIGEIVAAKTVGGQTALRAYQPKVKNPNTKRQQTSRGRMRIVSQIAAFFGEAIGIGYAAACKGLKMYPRNLFVSNLVKDTNCLETEDGAILDFDPTAFYMSKAAGFSVVPQLTLTPATGSDPAKITVTNAADFVFDPMKERLGLVIVTFNSVGDSDGKIIVDGVRVIKSDTLENVSIPASESGKRLYAFVKMIPNSGNEVDSSQWPWKYPSATSATAYVGTVE